jgi:hypothetical protein
LGRQGVFIGKRDPNQGDGLFCLRFGAPDEVQYGCFKDPDNKLKIPTDKKKLAIAKYSRIAIGSINHEYQKSE